MTNLCIHAHALEVVPNPFHKATESKSWSSELFRNLETRRLTMLARMLNVLMNHVLFHLVHMVGNNNS
jgi:hypothetical protein